MKTETPVSQPANFRNHPQFKSFLASAPVWIIFIIGIWLVILKGFGLQWEFVPGDLGDGRFNNYVLEHFFLWVKGALPVPSYWDAAFFYPSQNVTAFSDTLLGAAPIYAFFRWIGLDRETAFQCWFLCGFLLNYTAAAYVLSRAKLMPLAVGVGAFFFTFGIPLLSMGGHFQLHYRFGIPLACFFLLEFFNRPKLTRLAALAFWLVWQFYLSIYLGLFLVLLLAALALLMPFLAYPATGASLQERISQWPRKLKQAWLQTELKERLFSLLIIGAAGICLFALLWPYYKVSTGYGFSRDWVEVTKMLPVPETFFISDGSGLWNSISPLLGKDIKVRHEHQLFPGIAIAIMLVSALIVRFKSKNSRTAWLYFGAMILLVIVIFNFQGYSIYWLIWKIPGVNSIRAVTRIQMVWMWPLAFFAAWVTDSLLQWAQQKARWLYVGVFLLITLLMAESTFFLQAHYLKADGQARIARLERKLPEKLPPNPILIVAYSKNEPSYLTEIDAMLTAQKLGWPTLNGYSGSSPSSYALPRTCADIQNGLQRHADVFNYKAIMMRIVPIGFQDCKPSQ